MHTSGLWKANLDQVNGHLGWSIEVNGKAIASADVNLFVSSWKREGIIAAERQENAESVSNARLIAAAPKLLEALEEARGAININNPDGPGWPVLLAKMGAAIAEARGK